MSMEVIQNVVEMVFDNNSFEKKVGTTLDTLSKLKEALNFEGAVQGLENLGASIKDAGMDKLYEGVYKVQDGFNALDVVATRVLQNITDKVQGAAENLVKELTVAPLKSGLEEYETQINSVQTILANTNDALIEKGLTTEHDRIEKVNGVLDELNQYADMTIYNFTEMTRNIGTFTAAGVELDTAATSIKGIANLAAMSGSNSQQASTAMYQLSQAIAAGSVKLQDWNSVVNAGMGGKLFQNELIDTAKAMGVADEQFQELINGTTTFRESLSSGWISAEVLTNTLEKFTAGSEGYTRAQVDQMKRMWEARGYSATMIDEMTKSLTILDEEQEKNLRTKWAEKGFSDEQIDHILNMGMAATDAATKVKTFSQLIDTLKEALQSGWTQSWEYIIGDFEQAKRLWTEISDILNMYIGQSSDARNKVLEEWSKATYAYNEAGELVYAADGRIVEGGKMIADEMGGRELVIQGLRNSFQGLMEVVVYFRNIWDKVFVNGDLGDGKTRDSLVLTGDVLKDFSRKFHDFTEEFKNSFGTANNPSEKLTALGNGFTYFAAAARHAYDGISGVFSGIKNIFKALFNSDVFSTDSFMQLGMAVNMLARPFEKFGQAIRDNFDGAKNLESLTKLFDGLFNVFSTFKFIQLDFITNSFDALGEVIEHLIGPGQTIASLLGKLGSKLDIFANALSSVFMDEDVPKVEELFKTLANSFNRFIDVVKQSVDFSGFTKFFNNIIEAMTSKDIRLFDIIGNSIKSLVDILKAFIGIASPIAAAFADVFGDWIFNAAKGLVAITDRLRSFTKSLVPSGEVMTSIQHVFTGIFKIVTALADVIGNVLLGAWDGLSNIISSFLPDGKSLSKTLTEWGDKFIDVSKVIESLVSGEDGAPKLSEIIKRMSDRFVGFFGSLKDINLLEKVSNLFKAIGDGIKHALGGTEDMTLLDTILNGIKNFLQRLKDILSDKNGELDFVKVLEAGGIGVVIKKLVDFFKELKEGTGDFKGFLGIFAQIGDAFEELSESLGEKFKAETIKVIATAILEIAAALFIIAMIDPVALAMAIAAVAGMFDLIDTLLLSLKNFNKSDAAVLAAIAGVIQTIGTSVLMMAGAIAILGSMDLPNVVQGLVAITLMMQMMVKVVKQLSTIEGSLPKVAGAMIGLAVALNLLIIPVMILGGMDLPSLAKGLLAVAAMMGALVGAAIALSKWGKDFKASTAFGLIMMAESIKILASAVLMVKDVPWPDLAKGLAVMAAALIGMVGATAIIAKAKLGDDLMMLGASLLMLGTAMMMLTASAKGLAGISWEDLGKLAAVLAGALIALGVAAAVINGPNLFLIGSGVLMVAEAIALLVGVLMTAEVLGPICMGIGAGLQGIADSLTSFAHHAAASAFLQFLEDAILLLPKLAVGLAKAVVAMVVELGNGAAEIVGAVVKIGGAILDGIRTLLPQLFSIVREVLEQTFQLLIDEIPRAFEVLGVFFTQLWSFLITQTPGLFTWLNGLFAGLWGFLTGQVPNFFNWLTSVFTGLFTFLQTSGPLLIETIRLMIDTILKAIIEEAPVIGETLLTLLRTLLDVINTAIPEISFTLLNLLLTLLQQLAAFIPQMTQAAMDIILGFLNGIAVNIGQIVESAANIAIAFMDGLAVKMPEIVDSAFNLIIQWIDGLATAIDNNHDALWDAIGHLITSIVEAIIDGVTKLATAAGKLIEGFLAEFDGPQLLKDLADAGMNLIMGIVNGVGDAARHLYDKVKEVAANTLGALTGAFAEHSPSKKGEKIGYFLGIGTANGIDKSSKVVANSAGAMAEVALDALNSINDMDDFDIDPVITPVFDMSNIQNGIAFVDRAFDGINSDAVVGIDVTNKREEKFMADFTKQNAKSLSQAIDNYFNNPMRNPSKLEINVYGTSSPDDVANAVGQKVRLLGLV